jgi:hypothetical protein
MAKEKETELMIYNLTTLSCYLIKTAANAADFFSLFIPFCNKEFSVDQKIEPKPHFQIGSS